MLCPHNLNPKACLKCFHEGQASAATSQPKPKPNHPYGGQNPAANPVVAAVKARAGRMPGDIVPQNPGPVVMASGGAEPPQAPEQADDRPKVRGKMPRPVQHGGGSTAGKAGPSGGNVPQAFHYADDQGRTDSKGIWHPPKHRSIIDRAPRHPNAGDKPTIVR